MKKKPHLVLFLTEEEADATQHVDEDIDMANIEQNETEDSENTRMLQMGQTGAENEGLSTQMESNPTKTEQETNIPPRRIDGFLVSHRVAQFENLQRKNLQTASHT